MSADSVVGLDLSLTATGGADDLGQPFTLAPRLRGCERLSWIRDNVLTYLTPAPDLVVIEGYSFSSRNSHAHALGELGGVIRLALHEAGIAYVDVPPSSLKKYATGKGNANKGEMLAAAIRRLDYQSASDNEADALWLRAMGLDALGCPVVDLPAVNRQALTKVAWPVDDEFGIGGPDCEHPSLTGDRCDACGWKRGEL